jgi:hypothetical protein
VTDLCQLRISSTQLRKWLISECSPRSLSLKLENLQTSSVNPNVMSNFGTVIAAIPKARIRFPTIFRKESSNVRKTRGATEDLVHDIVVDVTGNCIRRVFKWNSGDGPTCWKSNTAALVQRSICGFIGGLGSLMYWN